MAFSLFINGPPGTEEKESVLVCQLREANSNLVQAALNARKLQEGAELALLNEDRFLAILAHELRNPLTPISLAVKSLATMIDANEQLPRLQETLARQVKHLVYLVTTMDDMSRIKCGKLRLNMQRVNLVDIVLAALEMAQPFGRGACPGSACSPAGRADAGQGRLRPSDRGVRQSPDECHQVYAQVRDYFTGDAA